MVQQRRSKRWRTRLSSGVWERLRASAAPWVEEVTTGERLLLADPVDPEGARCDAGGRVQ